MKRSRKIIGRAISTLLLLIFSVTIAPLDYLHSHSPEPVCAASQADESTCRHKIHISKKGTFCLLCTVHHGQAVTPLVAGGATFLPVVKFIFPDYNTRSISLAFPFSLLRGPPEEGLFVS